MVNGYGDAYYAGIAIDSLSLANDWRMMQGLQIRIIIVVTCVYVCAMCVRMSECVRYNLSVHFLKWILSVPYDLDPEKENSDMIKNTTKKTKTQSTI